MDSKYAHLLSIICRDYPCTKLYLKQTGGYSMTTVLAAVDYWTKLGFVQCCVTPKAGGGKPPCDIRPTDRAVYGAAPCPVGGYWIARLPLNDLPRVTVAHADAIDHTQYGVMADSRPVCPPWQSLDNDAIVAWATRYLYGTTACAVCAHPLHAVSVHDGQCTVYALDDLPSSYIDPRTARRLTMQQALDNPTAEADTWQELQSLLQRFLPVTTILRAWQPLCPLYAAQPQDWAGLAAYAALGRLFCGQ